LVESKLDQRYMRKDGKLFYKWMYDNKREANSI
jgi:hypothetical protein